MIRGEKFEIDLGSDDESGAPQPKSVLPATFVTDVLERQTNPPSAPTLRPSANKGFPAHGKRNIQSRFKQQKATTGDNVVAPPSVQSAAPGHVAERSDVPTDSHVSGKAKSWEEEEKERIDQENRQRLADMSPAEIEEERRELISHFSPAMLQRLLQKSNVESGSTEVDLSRTPEQNNTKPLDKPSKPAKTVTFEEPPHEDRPDEEQVNGDQDARAAGPLPHDSVHFPRPPQPPSLDPSSESFFEDLHQKYFPSLPSDPDKLEWMQSSTSQTDSYDPSASKLGAKDIRFSFKGELIAPRTASEIPVTEGLHHHGDAPDAAGYTIAELAHLARSSYPAQRCIAFQTLGRVLYRLSQGEFGDPGEPGEEIGAEDTFGELARGLWREVERLKVIQILVDESEGRGVDGGKHVSAKAYATEAVWLWNKGGGRRWKAA